jgi:hypothetical protein
VLAVVAVVAGGMLWLERGSGRGSAKVGSLPV